MKISAKNDITVEHVAKQVNMSKRNFIHYFKKRDFFKSDRIKRFTITSKDSE